MTNFYDKSETLGSSWIEEAFYDTKTQTLYAKMTASKAVYGHKNVPEDVYDQFITSYSPGQFYNGHIKGYYTPIIDVIYDLKKRSGLFWTVTVSGTWDIEVQAETLEDAKNAALKDAPEGLVIKGARVSFE